ncbi:Palmitoyl-protein thioesterase 1 [Phytophthora pseudosyringae]|uniref:Palmitoyl-protein thioesterase 1 n=1 Tax=Phytophthora pseudosyringae TaxID=221518 RepID=A0A8T1VZH1_9STRA|nr:Palmitoyl-protein thioesterase 1 [Phytophthora pseudosyringae]
MLRLEEDNQIQRESTAADPIQRKVHEAREMARGNRLMLIVAAITAVLVLVQFVLISEESVTYFEEEKPLQLEEKAAAPVKIKSPVFQQATILPVVLMHGMGDAAANGGMKRIQKAIAEHLGVYVASVQLGDTVAEDVQNSFFITMNNQTEMFAKIVREDPQLTNGFNAAGFSQVNWERIAQANYFRDPLRIEAYLKHAEFLPDLNNEKTSTNQTYKENFIKLQNLVLVRANKDTQVFPKESEWFGMYQDGDQYKNVLTFNETRWYQEDLFGLQTLDKAGKVHFLSTDGDHLRFSVEFLLGVVDKYFRPQILIS